MRINGKTKPFIKNKFAEWVDVRAYSSSDKRGRAPQLDPQVQMPPPPWQPPPQTSVLSLVRDNLLRLHTEPAIREPAGKLPPR